MRLDRFFMQLFISYICFIFIVKYYLDENSNYCRAYKISTSSFSTTDVLIFNSNWVFNLSSLLNLS